MIQDERLQQVAMTIIANSGASKGSSFGALAESKSGNYEKAEQLLGEADDYLAKAQKCHRDLLAMDAKDLVPQVDILLTHCQDHFMMAALAKDLITELVKMYRLINSKQGKEETA